MKNETWINQVSFLKKVNVFFNYVFIISESAKINIALKLNIYTLKRILILDI